MKPLPGQLGLFPPPQTGREAYETPPVPLNSTVEPEDETLAAQQQAAILARLQRGPATNAELIMIAGRFGARLHELKPRYPWVKKRIGRGLFEYRLIGE